MSILKQEIISQFEGFGNDKKVTRGEHYRSSGFIKSQNGISTGGSLLHLMDAYSLTDIGTTTTKSLCYARGFANSTQTPSNYLYNSNVNGEIIQSLSGSLSGSSAEYAHRSQQNKAYFHHLITDPKGRVLYHQDRYLGMFDGTGATTNYITGTVSVTNSSTAVVGTGTTFTAGMVGKTFQIAGETKSYTVATYTDATHITINSYTGITGSGKSYKINTQWNDTWKDFGAVVTLTNGNNTPNCPMDIYEDTVIFGRGNVITTLNVLTDTITTDALPALNLPAGYAIDHIVSNANGILIGGNVRSKGFLLLWDNLSDRAIAPWIWFDDSVLSICKNGANWTVITSRAIYNTNGYSTEKLATGLLESSTSNMVANVPKSTIVIEDALHFFGTGTSRGWKRNVLYRLDLNTKLVEAYPRYTLNQGSPTCVAMEYVSEINRLFLALNGNGNENGVDYLFTSSAPECSTFITSNVGLGENQKVAKRIKLRIRQSSKRVSNISNTIAFKVAVKIADMKHTMYGFSQTKVASADESHITINGTIPSFLSPKIGHEIEFVGDSGVDTNAGYSRNVISKTGEGTATEVWTLDSALPEVPAMSQNMTITPFQLVSRKTVSVTDGEIIELIFEVKNSIKSSKFRIKVDIEANEQFSPLELSPIVFIYEDTGVL